jgi:hypothetical protein
MGAMAGEWRLAVAARRMRMWGLGEERRARVRVGGWGAPWRGVLICVVTGHRGRLGCARVGCAISGPCRPRVPHGPHH